MTRKIFLIAGVAALAVTAPAAAERGGKRDRDAQAQTSRGGGERAQRPQRTERPQRAERQSIQRAERPQRVERQRIQRAERPQRMERQRFERAERPARIERQRIQRAERPTRIERQRTERAERPNRVERQRFQRAERPARVERQRIQRAERPARIERQRIQQAERRQQKIDRQRFQRAERPSRIERQRIESGERQLARQFDRRELRGERVRPGRDQTVRDIRREVRDDRRLARLFNDRPMREMSFRDDRRLIAVGDRIDPARFSSYVPTVYRTRYYDTPEYYYRYDDDLGYLYRVDRDDNFVRALIPLFGGYGIGDPWPRTYYSSYVPLGYRSYYYDTPDHYYRYDGYGIYRINAETQMITALVALLTGQGFGVGQMLPASYSAYNVPMAYRTSYYDRPDAWYRYGDGFIYQVDPYSRRIEDRFPVYGAGYDYMIGEPWPVAYPGYNVPVAYQPLYYDTPQYHYRYANGGIYRIDPTTQVIQALVALVSGQQFGIGQPMPSGYSTYNVPFAYRDRYYDRDDAWYRYANGYVYQVDPVSGLIEDSYPIYA